MAFARYEIALVLCLLNFATLRFLTPRFPAPLKAELDDGRAPES